MRIRLSQPAHARVLRDFLAGAGFGVREERTGELEVQAPAALDEAQARRELELYLTTWRVRHAGIEVALLD